MREFYRAGQSGPLTKAEALRSAQLSLYRAAPAEATPTRARVGVPLPFKIEVVDAPGIDKRRAFRTYERGAEIVYVEKGMAPAFYTERNRPFAHPYYWAPFILIGNGR